VVWCKYKIHLLNLQQEYFFTKMSYMNVKIEIDSGSTVPVYKQLIQNIETLVVKGKYKEGDFIPSMNELSNELEISKETVKKAYSILREKGLIDSSHGKGFYVTNNQKAKIKILLLFDKISTYKQVLYSSFIETIGETAEITIRLHNQDFDLFEQFLEENLDHFDYYIITPHFPLKPEIQKKVVKILKKIPNRKLILLDRNIDELPGNYGAIYQDFEQDVFDGLMQGITQLNKYDRLNIISMPGSMYAPLIKNGIKRFCTKNKIKYKFYTNINPDNIQRKEAFLILNSQLDTELIELVRIAKSKKCEIGEDIGIISYNESPVNEIILNGLSVLSTDFKQMGELAAKMILEKSFKKIKCDFGLIKRSSM